MILPTLLERDVNHKGVHSPQLASELCPELALG